MCFRLFVCFRWFCFVFGDVGDLCQLDLGWGSCTRCLGCQGFHVVLFQVVLGCSGCTRR